MGNSSSKKEEPKIEVDTEILKAENLPKFDLSNIDLPKAPPIMTKKMMKK
jgi:hypothetical protein